MGFAYTIKNQGNIHFVTFTVHQWADVFTRQIYIDILLESLRFCQQEKGLNVYAWVVMSNHCHFIVSANENNLSDIIRDFKKFTAKSIYAAIENNKQESRKGWLLRVLKFNDKIWFWEEGYHGEEILSQPFYEIKLNYIHMNPVKAGVVEKEDEYLNSSAGELCGIRKSKLTLSEF